jgi:hypothetical protein
VEKCWRTGKPSFRSSVVQQSTFIEFSPNEDEDAVQEFLLAHFAITTLLAEPTRMRCIEGPDRIVALRFDRLQ